MTPYSREVTEMQDREEITKKVIEDIEQISKKHNITVSDILKIISSYEKESKSTFHIRYSDSELEMIDRKCAEKGLSRGNYCALCFKKAIDEKLYENMNLVQIAKRSYRNETRKNRIHISIKKLGINAKDIVQFAESRDLEVSALLRYFSLTVSL